MTWSGLLIGNDRDGARVAPLSVSALMRDHIFADRTAALTSATPRLGGEFTAIATSVGLKTDERVETPQGDIAGDTASDKRQQWRAIDVGSPLRLPAAGDPVSRAVAAAAGPGRPVQVLPRRNRRTRSGPLADAPSCFLHVGPPKPPPPMSAKGRSSRFSARATPSCPNSPDGSLRTRS